MPQTTLVSSHLRVFTTEVAVHGGAGGHLGPAEVTGLSFHLLVGQVDVLLQHVLRQVLLIACGTCPRLPHCGESIGFISPDVSSNINITEASAFILFSTVFATLQETTSGSITKLGRGFCDGSRNVVIVR